MKRVLITVVALIGIAGLITLLSYHPQTPTATGSTTSTVPLSQTSPSAATASSSPSNLKDGTYAGDAVDVGYGTVQVQAVVAGGKITTVNFVQMPNDRDRSVMIADQAKPILLQEAVTAQSANVDTVSGATADSEGFTQSLQSALNKA